MKKKDLKDGIHIKYKIEKIKENIGHDREKVHARHFGNKSMKN